MTTDGPAFEDPLAAALWEARSTHTAVDRVPWNDLPKERGEAVAGELYARLRDGGERQVGAKVVATDAPTQRRLGADGPLVAPLFGDAVVPVGSAISLSSLIKPVLEAEIGMRVDGEDVLVMPCVEIPDSRFTGGTPTMAHVAADFGGQAVILFGTPAPCDEVVQVTVTRDGEPVVSASRDLAAARSTLDLVRQRFPELGGDEPASVATGTLFPPVPLERGRWRVDFARLGAIEFDVVD